MNQIQNNRKCCATCGYWLGNRIPDHLGFVLVSSATDLGQCSNRSLTEQYIRQANFCCRDYCKWVVLR